MNVVLSIAEINLLLSTKTAQENYVYVCEDGFLYKGQKNGQVQRLLNTNYDDWVRQRNSNQTLPYRNKTIEQGTRQSDGDIADVKVSDEGTLLIEVSKSKLPENASTESSMISIIEEIKTTNSNSEETINTIKNTSESEKLNQYLQIELLNLIYDELQIQTKLLKKIYQ